MEGMIIGILVVWIAVSTLLAGLLARNSKSPAANATILAVGGYVVMTAALFALLSPTVPPLADPVQALLPPLAIAGGVAAVIVWILAFIRTGQVRKARS